MTEEDRQATLKSMEHNKFLAQKHDEEHTKTEMDREVEREIDLYWVPVEDRRPNF